MKLNFGTIGSGWITDEYIKGAKDSGLWNLTAVYSRSAARGEQYAMQHGASHVFTDVLSMAQSDVIDAVYIASPNVLHYEQCKVFLQNKKHVICEKPISAHASDVLELLELAKENHVIFLEAIMYLHLPQKKNIESALLQIAPLSFVKIDFCQRSSKMDDFLAGNIPNIFNPQMETGAFMDLGVYCIYPVLDLFGLPQKVSAQSTLLETKADAAGIVTLTYPDKLVTLTYSKIGQAVAGSEFQGKNGTLYVDSISRLAGITLTDGEGNKQCLGEDEEKYKLMGYEAKDFHRYITQPEESIEEYRHCIALSLEVSVFMENLRKELHIVFPRDASTPNSI